MSNLFISVDKLSLIHHNWSSLFSWSLCATFKKTTLNYLNNFTIKYISIMQCHEKTFLKLWQFRYTKQFSVFSNACTFNATVPAIVVVAPITTTFSISIIVLYDFIQMRKHVNTYNTLYIRNRDHCIACYSYLRVIWNKVT